MFFLNDPGWKDEYYLDAWSSFIRKNPTYMTHTLVDINEMMSDIISILHLSLNMPDMPQETQTSPAKSVGDSCQSPKKRSLARCFLVT